MVALSEGAGWRCVVRNSGVGRGTVRQHRAWRKVRRTSGWTGGIQLPVPPNTYQYLTQCSSEAFNTGVHKAWNRSTPRNTEHRGNWGVVWTRHLGHDLDKALAWCFQFDLASPAAS